VLVGCRRCGLCRSGSYQGYAAGICSGVLQLVSRWVDALEVFKQKPRLWSVNTTQSLRLRSPRWLTTLRAASCILLSVWIQVYTVLGYRLVRDETDNVPPADVEVVLEK
jgi:hypothetical protein